MFSIFWRVKFEDFSVAFLRVSGPVECDSVDSRWFSLGDEFGRSLINSGSCLV